MAGFSFKKLTKEKNTSKVDSTRKNNDSSPNSSKFMHFNLSHNSSNDEDDIIVPKPNQFPSAVGQSPQQQHHYSNNNNKYFQNQPSQPQKQMQYNASQARVFPTPQPYGQRNVSGATQLMQIQQQQRQQQQQQSPVQRPTQPQSQLPVHESNDQQPLSSHVQQQTMNSNFPSTPQQVNRQVSAATNNSNASDRDNQITDESVIWNRVKLRDSPFPRYRHVASSYVTENDTVFVIGGLHDQSVYGDIWLIKSLENGNKFTSSTVEISENTPPPRVGHAATLCGNAFVVFGGDTHKVNNDGLMDDDLYLFNINSHKWTIPQPIGPRPLGRYGHKICIIATTPMKTKLYLFGGQFDDTYFNNLAMFDLSSFRRPDSHWEFLKPKSFIPPPLTNHTMVSYDDKIWVFGGDTVQGLTNKVFMYDPEINDWCIIDTTAANNNPENNPPPMQEHAAVMYGNLMCVVGGKDEQDNYMNTVYFLNMDTFEWFKLPLLTVGIPQGRSGHSISLLKNNKLLIMGGDKFDFARQDEYDLHSSEIDMGCGTLLYTLDLSHLSSLCPGITRKPSQHKLSHTITSDSTESNIRPRTPPINASDNMGKFNQRNVTPTSTNRNGSIQRDTNKLPEIAAQNILTPQVALETQETPKTYNAENFNEDHGTKTIPAQEGDSFSRAHKIDAVSSSSNTAEISVASRDASIQQRSEHEISSITTPTTEQTAVDHTETASAIVNTSYLSSNKQEQQAEQNYLKDEQLKYSSDNAKHTRNIELPEDNLSHAHVGEKEKQYINTAYEEKDVKNSRKSADINESLVPSFNPPETHTPNNMIQVDRKVLKDLYDELKHLKELTNEKAIEASQHIKLLEAENNTLRESVGEKVINGTEISSLIDKNTQLNFDNNDKEMRIQELESLVSEKFMHMDNLNQIIRRQNLSIDKLMLDERYKEKYSDLEARYKLLTEENIRLKGTLEGYDNKFHNDIKAYSNRMELLLGKWKGKTGMSLTRTSTDLESDDSAHFAPHHDKINKLSKKLDELLAKSQDLSYSRDRLDAEYIELTKTHRSLSQDILSNQNGSDNASNEVATTDTKKTLELAQAELEKYREKNKTLQEELEKLKHAQNVTENVDDNNDDLT